MTYHSLPDHPYRDISMLQQPLLLRQSWIRAPLAEFVHGGRRLLW